MWVNFVIKEAEKPVYIERTMKQTQQRKERQEAMCCWRMWEYLVLVENHVCFQTFVRSKLYFLTLYMLNFSGSCSLVF